MKRKIILLSLIFFNLKSLANNQESLAYNIEPQEDGKGRRLYVGASGGMSILPVSDSFLNNTQFIKSIELKPNIQNRAWLYGFNIGYYLTPQIIIEVEADFKSGHSLELNFSNNTKNLMMQQWFPGAFTTTNDSLSVKINSRFYGVNMRYEIASDSLDSLIPYIKLGVGRSQLNLGVSEIKIVNNTPNQPGGVLKVKDIEAHGIAAQLGLGVSYALSDRAFLDIGASLHYVPKISLDHMKIESIIDGKSTTNDNTNIQYDINVPWLTTDIRAGLRFKL